MMSDNDGEPPMAMASEMDCECPMDQMQCDQCLSMLDLSSPVALPVIESNSPQEISSSNNYPKRYLPLYSVILAHTSPPPING